MTDIAVGTDGRVVIMSSVPLLSVAAQLSVSVRRLPIFWGRCGAAGDAVGLRLCFHPHLHSPTYSGQLQLPIVFLLVVDPQRRLGRGSLSSGSQKWEGRLELRGGQQCLNESLSVQPCPDDSLTPLRLAVNFSLDPTNYSTNDLKPVLDPTATSVWIEIPFEQHCGADGLCQPDLELSEVAPPGGWVQLGGPAASFSAAFRLRNRAEDARSVSVSIRHPGGTALRRARAATEGDSTPVPIDCRELTAGTDVGTDVRTDVGSDMGSDMGMLLCHVGHPVLRANSTVLLEVTLEVTQNRSWGAKLRVWGNASSPNEAAETLGDNTAWWSAPVRYRVGVVATWLEDSTPYLNFTPGQTHSAVLRHHYQVQTLLPPPLGAPLLNLTAFLLLPQTLPHGLAWQPRVHLENGGQCEEMGEKEMEPQWGLEKGCVPPDPPFLFRCPLGPHGGGKVLLSASVKPPPHKQPPSRSRFCSLLRFSFGSELFLNGIAGAERGAQGVTEVELLPAPPRCC